MISTTVNSLPDEEKLRILQILVAQTQRALMDLCQQSEADAAAIISDLQKRYKHATQTERDLLLHNDPVSLACELADVEWSD